MTGLLATACLDLLILGGFTLLGVALFRALRVEGFWIDALGVGPGLGVGALTWTLFLVSWAGVPLRSTSACVALTVLLLACGGAILAQRGRQRGDPEPVLRPFSLLDRWGSRALWLAIASHMVLAVVLGVGLSYYTWDAIATWGIGGYGIALEGSVFGASRWGNAGLLYPFNIQLAVAVFRMLDGDILPGSKLLFPIFYVVLLLGCYRFWTKRGVRRWIASFGCAMLASTPIVFRHATMGYANLPFSYYMVIGTLWLVDAAVSRDSREAAVGGCLVALGIWTRPEGLAMAAAVLLSLAVVHGMDRRLSLPWAACLAPILGLAVPWSVFHATHQVGTVEAYRDIGPAVEGLLRGDVRWQAMVTIGRFVAGQIVRYRDWGYTLLALALALPLLFHRREARRDPRLRPLLAIAAGMAVVVLGSHYMAAYSARGPEFLYTWLSLEFTRLIMPVGILVLVAVVLAAGHVAARREQQPVVSDHSPGIRPV